MDALKEDLIKINRSDAKISAIYSEIANRLGLSDSEFDILYALANIEGPALIKDVCFFACLKKQTVNSALRKMERDGILYLEAVNGKSKMVKLTEKGMELMKNTIQKEIDLEIDILREWTDEERKTFIHLNDKYLSQFEKKTKEL